MKYLPKETCQYLVSLGCKSDSGKSRYFNDGDLLDMPGFHPKYIPAFSLEDILRKENAEKIWTGYWHPPDDCYGVGKCRKPLMHEDWPKYARRVLEIFQSHPDTWPEEVAKFIDRVENNLTL